MQQLARQNMIDGQLRPNHINNHALLARFEGVAREDFVPAAYKKTAYADTVTPLGQERVMLSPMVLARLLQAVEIQPEDRVLVVAGNTGYSTALLAPLCAGVVMTEDDTALLPQARENLERVPNVKMVDAPPTSGFAEHAPYNVILLDAPAETVPARLIEQLAEGGRLACVVVGENALLVARVYTRHGGTLFHEDLCEAKGALHPELTSAEAFVF